MNTLVVHYSRTGRTSKVAAELAAALGADSDSIIDRTNRSGLIGWLRSGRDATRRYTTELEPPKKDPSAYDLVVIGSPIWNANMSTPVLTYLKQFSGKLPKVAFFITCGGRVKRPFDEMGEACAAKPVATMMVLVKEIKKGTHVTKIEQFARQLNSP
jgi:flavodoxin